MSQPRVRVVARRGGEVEDNGHQGGAQLRERSVRAVCDEFERLRHLQQMVKRY